MGGSIEQQKRGRLTHESSVDFVDPLDTSSTKPLTWYRGTLLPVLVPHKRTGGEMYSAGCPLSLSAQSSICS